MLAAHSTPSPIDLLLDAIDFEMIAKPRQRPLFAEQRSLRQQAGRTRHRAVASAAERIRTAARLRRRKDRRRRRRRRRRGRSASIPPDGELVFGTAQIQCHRVEARPGGVRMLGLSGVPILDDVVVGPLDLTTRTVFLFHSVFHPEFQLRATQLGDVFDAGFQHTV